MSILSGIFGGDNSFGDVKNELERNRALYDQLELPQYKEYVPELYNSESANYALTGDDPLVKSRQEQLLSELSGLKDTGLSDVDQAEFAKARDMGNQMAKASTGAAIQDAQNRGVGGSGMEFALREMAGQGGAQRAQEQGLQTAADAARQRAMYMQAYGSELGNQRAANYQQNAANTNIINDFNRANTAQRNQTSQANTNTQNQAYQYNQGMQTQNFNNQLSKINGQTSSNGQIANAYAAQGAADQADRNALLGIGTTLGAAALGRK